MNADQAAQVRLRISFITAVWRGFSLRLCLSVKAPSSPAVTGIPDTLGVATECSQRTLLDRSRWGSTARRLAERLESYRALAPRQPEVDENTSQHDVEPAKAELSPDHSANELRRKCMAREEGNL